MSETHNYYIYKITCLNEIYIGSTKNPILRWKTHITDYKKKNWKNCKLYKKMDSVYDLNDKNCLNYEILECLNNCSRKDAMKKEQDYINKLKPTLNTVNAYLSEEQKKENHKNYMRKYRSKMTEEQIKERLKKKKEWYNRNKEVICLKERTRYKDKRIFELKEKMKKMEDNIKLLCQYESDNDFFSELEEINFDDLF